MSSRERALLRARRRAVAAARDELIDVQGASTTPSRRSWVLLGLVVVVAVAVVAGAGWWYGAAPHYFSDDEFIDAATDRVSLLIEADSHDRARARRILDGATGEFQATFAQSADAYTEYIASVGATGDGHVDAVALARRDGESAVLLVAASVTVTTSTGTDASPTDFRMRVLMTPEDDEIKIAGLQVIA